MRTIVVRYETKPDRADENQRLVEKVFAELAERRPESFRYATFRLEDGVSFVHVVIESGDGSNPVSLADIDAFAEFQKGSPTVAPSSPSRKALRSSGHIASWPTERRFGSRTGASELLTA